MQDRVDWIDTGGGHILVAFLVFLVGVGLVLARADVGKDIVMGACGLHCATRSGRASHK